MTIDDIISKKQFSEMVEKIAREKRMTYMEAVIKVCTDRAIDPLDVGPLITAPLKARIEQEAIADRLLPGHNTLPI